MKLLCSENIELPTLLGEPPNFGQTWRTMICSPKTAHLLLYARSMLEILCRLSKHQKLCMPTSIFMIRKRPRLGAINAFTLSCYLAHKLQRAITMAVIERATTFVTQRSLIEAIGLIFFIALARFLWDPVDSREPPALRSRIPLVGHLIGLIKNGPHHLPILG